MPRMNQFTGWPSRGKRFGEAENPGPTTYYPPDQQTSARVLAFRGQETGHCIIKYGNNKGTPKEST
eukprot:7554051-Heterocapsa_arctica.AAC.1